MPPTGAPRVVVVTGASSGMGKDAALRLARRGDRVVLAARRADALEETARACEREGGEALAVPTDVTDEAAVEELFDQAAARFGRVDAVAHAAAVAAFGHLWEIPVPAMRRLVDVTLVGSMIVAKHAVLRFRRQEEGGTLVLVSSVLGKTPIPYLSIYNAAKHGVVGLATSLRADLKEAGLEERVRVCNLMPPATDTPFYLHAANSVGRAPRPPPPVYDVETLGRAIVDAIDDPQDVVAVGAMGKLMRAAHAVAPGLYESATAPYSESMFLDQAVPPGDGALFAPMPQGRATEGGWKEGTLPRRQEEARR